MKAILATIIAASLTVGCGMIEGEQTTTDSGSTGGSTTTVDNTNPQISSTNVPDGSINVSTSDNIKIVFSEEIDQTTLTTSNIRVEDNAGNSISGSINYVSNEVTFSPDSELQSFSNYGIFVSSAIKDLAGNSLSESSSWNFTTSRIYNKTNKDDHGSQGQLDYNGHTYSVIKIGDRWWTAENLRTTTYNDGTSIPKWNSGSAPTSPAFCDSEDVTEYGYLYNEHVALEEKLVPTGWRIADYYTNGDYVDLIRSVDSTAGGLSTASSGTKLLITGSNDVNFSAKLSGIRMQGGSYTWMGGAGSHTAFGMPDDGVNWVGFGINSTGNTSGNVYSSEACLPIRLVEK